MKNNNSKIEYDFKDLDIDKITDKVLKLIKPTLKDLQILQSIEKKKKDMDIDIFILIDKDTNEHEFEKIALDVGFKCLKGYHPITRYSEHPYVEGFVFLNNNNNKEHVRLNVVPCYSVEKGNWKSSADRSQYHT